MCILVARKTTNTSGGPESHVRIVIGFTQPSGRPTVQSVSCLAGLVSGLQAGRLAEETDRRAGCPSESRETVGPKRERERGASFAQLSLTLSQSDSDYYSHSHPPLLSLTLSWAGIRILPGRAAAEALMAGAFTDRRTWTIHWPLER